MQNYSPEGEFRPRVRFHHVHAQFSFIDQETKSRSATRIPRSSLNREMIRGILNRVAAIINSTRGPRYPRVDYYSSIVARYRGGDLRMSYANSVRILGAAKHSIGDNLIA